MAGKTHTVQLHLFYESTNAVKSVDNITTRSCDTSQPGSLC